MKAVTVINLIASFIIFPLVIGLCKGDSLLVGLSILYCSSSIALLSFGFNKKYVDGHSDGRLITSIANITLLVSIIACFGEYMFGTEKMCRIITVSCIIFSGGCILLYLLTKRGKAKP